MVGHVLHVGDVDHVEDTGDLYSPQLEILFSLLLTLVVLKDSRKVNYVGIARPVTVEFCAPDSYWSTQDKLFSDWLASQTCLYQLL